MCWYDQKRWTCGYWRWSGFQKQCERETRIGETCGLKFVGTVYDQGIVCKICKDIDTKHRKMGKIDQDIARWEVEGDKPYSIRCAYEERELLEKKIQELSVKHWDDIHHLGVSWSSSHCCCATVANTIFLALPKRRIAVLAVLTWLVWRACPCLLLTRLPTHTHTHTNTFTITHTHVN